MAIKSLNALKESSSIGRGVYPSNVITVSGEGKVFAVPDTASFSFTVLEEGKTSSEAQSKATKKTNATIDAIKAMGIDAKDVKTIGYNLNPKYEYQTDRICTTGYCTPGKSVLVGYEVSQSILVKIRKTDQAGDVLTKVGTLGVSNISGLSFVTDDMDKIRADARAEAIGDAKAKAKVLANALGVDLGDIVSFNEGGAYPVPYYGGVANMKLESSMAMDASVAPQLPVGENEISSSVSITYEIR